MNGVRLQTLPLTDIPKRVAVQGSGSRAVRAVR
jgi:hypothetical protein